MDKNSNAFTLTFATIVCVVLAVCLSATFTGLKTQINANAEFDRQVNVLLAMGFHDRADASKSRGDLEKLFADRVVGQVLEVKRGMVDRDVRRGGKNFTEKVEAVVDVSKTEYDVGEIANLRREEAKKTEAEQREFVEIYRGTDEDGTAVWAIPISGYGLWSTLYGYLALEADVSTVRGITFYQHAETPGLGGEVDNAAWQKTWRGKTVRDAQGKVVGVALKKGRVDPKVDYEKAHMVDGLSGATITSNGVSRFVLADLQTYEPYFQKQRQS
ncbi:MAG: NADH:ubiquinone reductase (Na(+)-transporting) subunit C [Planctomycetota bacterium]